MKTRAIILVAMIAMLATMLCSCTSKEETAASKARDKFVDLRKADNGERAAKLAREIMALNPNRSEPVQWLRLVGIDETTPELNKCVEVAYQKEAAADLNDLENPMTAPTRAESLRKSFLNAQKFSGRSMKFFGTDSAQVDRLVMLSYLREAKAQSTPTIQDLRKVGILPEKKVLTAKPAKKVAKKKLAPTKVADNHRTK